MPETVNQFVVVQIENESDFPGVEHVYGPYTTVEAVRVYETLQSRGGIRGKTIQLARLQSLKD